MIAIPATTDSPGSRESLRSIGSFSLTMATRHADADDEYDAYASLVSLGSISGEGKSTRVRATAMVATSTRATGNDDGAAWPPDCEGCSDELLRRLGTFVDIMAS